MKKTDYHLLNFALFLLITLVSALCSSCHEKTKHIIDSNSDSSLLGISKAEKDMLKMSQTHASTRMQYKLISSNYDDKSNIWKLAKSQLGSFNESQYTKLFDYIYQKSIPSIQHSISNGHLSYEELTKWYLYRILKYERNPSTTLHAIISIMPNAVAEAKKRDASKSKNDHPIFGMPILLKDNINAEGAPTTAGAIALAENWTSDATIVANLKKNGAIILGKVNLSEWAYYFCAGCPLGYSAIGGQSLNPYGRAIFETGGSSAASGTSMAANYAAGAVGTETAGSILSPSSQNSIIGLKPTLGTLSRSGIVPISSTLDTPGPMTRNVVDNAILYSAMYGEDIDDPSTTNIQRLTTFDLQKTDIPALTLGANTNFINTNELYKETVEKLREKGVNIIEFTPDVVELDGFITVLDYDMQKDLPTYLSNYAAKNISISSVQSVIEYNLEDSTLRAPYGQAHFISSSKNTTSKEEIESIKSKLERTTRIYFDTQFDGHKLDAILSINNYDAARSAMAKYPCLALPMGYTDKGEPQAMTLIGKRYDELMLLSLGVWFEENIFKRTPPKGY